MKSPLKTVAVCAKYNFRINDNLSSIESATIIIKFKIMKMIIAIEINVFNKVIVKPFFLVNVCCLLQISQIELLRD